MSRDSDNPLAETEAVTEDAELSAHRVQAAFDCLRNLRETTSDGTDDNENEKKKITMMNLKIMMKLNMTLMPMMMPQNLITTMAGQTL